MFALIEWLEAKNAGSFGQRGILMEEQTFDQECDACAAEMEADEGYGGMGGEDIPIAAAVNSEGKDKGKGKGRETNTDRTEDGRRQKGSVPHDPTHTDAEARFGGPGLRTTPSYTR